MSIQTSRYAHSPLLFHSNPVDSSARRSTPMAEELFVNHLCWLSSFKPNLSVHGDNDKSSEHPSDSDRLSPRTRWRRISSDDRCHVRELISVRKKRLVLVSADVSSLQCVLPMENISISIQPVKWLLSHFVLRIASRHRQSSGISIKDRWIDHRIEQNGNSSMAPICIEISGSLVGHSTHSSFVLSCFLFRIEHQ